MSASFAPAAPPPVLPTGGMVTSKKFRIEINFCHPSDESKLLKLLCNLFDFRYLGPAVLMQAYRWIIDSR